jgi:hypothetical protein
MSAAVDTLSSRADRLSASVIRAVAGVGKPIARIFLGIPAGHGGRPFQNTLSNGATCATDAVAPITKVDAIKNAKAAGFVDLFLACLL